MHSEMIVRRIAEGEEIFVEFRHPETKESQGIGKLVRIGPADVKAVLVDTLAGSLEEPQALSEQEEERIRQEQERRSLSSEAEARIEAGELTEEEALAEAGSGTARGQGAAPAEEDMIVTAGQGGGGGRRRRKS